MFRKSGITPEDIEGFYHEGLLTPTEAVVWLANVLRTFDALSEALPFPKFQIGDKVVYTNDYGVSFRDKTITGVEIDSDSLHPVVIRYFYEPHDAYWYSAMERNFTLQ